MTEPERGVQIAKNFKSTHLNLWLSRSYYPPPPQNETFGGVTYHIEGELVPALHLELSSTGVYFEHHILLWKDPAVQSSCTR